MCRRNFISFTALTEADEEVYCAGELADDITDVASLPLCPADKLLREPCPMSSIPLPASVPSLFDAALRCERRLGRLHLRLDLLPQGRDWLALLHGGTAHIGAMALALPPQERAAAAEAAQSIGRPGHREEELARQVAARLAQAAGCAVCCCAGIHYEAITPEEIRQVLRLADELSDEAACLLRQRGHGGA